MDDAKFSYSSKDGVNHSAGNDCSVPTCDSSAATDNAPKTPVTTSDPLATTSEQMGTLNVSEEAIASPKDAFRRGHAYAKEGNLAMAEKMFQQALSGYEMKHGSQHQATLAMMTILGNLYADKGDAGKAERLYRGALDIRERTLGPDDESTLGAVLNLGALLSENGRLEEAEQLYRRALDGYEKTVGPNHTSTMKPLNNLANLLAGQGRFDGVEDMYKRILAFYDDTTVAEEEASSRYTTLMNLGILHTKQENVREAEKELQQALEGHEKWLGPNDRLTLLNISSLGVVYAKMQDVPKAKHAYRRALEGFERTLGYDSPLAIMVSRNIELLEIEVHNRNAPPKEDVETGQLALNDTNSSDDELEGNELEDGESSNLLECTSCESIKNAYAYTPVNIPTIVFTEFIISGASDGCASCQFLESILRLRMPEVFAHDDTSLYVSWRPGKHWKGSTNSYPSKIIFWVRNETTAAEAEDYTVIDIFTLPSSENPCPWWDLGAARIPPKDTFSEASFLEAVAWLQRCRGFHGRCNEASTSEPYLPTRIIDVDPIGTDGSVKLVEPKGESGKYLCLSYCWGDATHILKSTHQTKSQWMKEIPWSVLPKTFQDAITFVRRLGHRYIWIDSLCIIQDDFEDWEREAAQMASIYRNSYLTLAATASRDGRGGCFFTQDEKHHAEVLTVNVKGVPYTLYCRETFPHFAGPDLKLTMTPLGSIQENFPLLTRGWVHQERLLSPRVLHFGRQELIWECMEEHICQCQSSPVHDVGFPKTKYSVALESSSPRDLVRLWKGMIADYTRLGLTIPSDRLPALAGMANNLKSSIGGSYLSGLWQESLIEDMLWMSPAEDRIGRRTKLDPKALPQHIPTWSWASIEGRVVYPPDGNLSIFSYGYAKVDLPDFTGDTLVRASHSTIIAITGPVVSAVLRYEPNPHDPDSDPRIILRLDGDHTISQDFRQDYDYYHGRSSDHISDGLGFRPDYDLWRQGSDHIPAGTALTCLLMWRTRFIGHDPFGREEMEYALVLRHLDDEKGVFERVGMLRKKAEWDVLSGSEGVFERVGMLRKQAEMDVLSGSEGVSDSIEPEGIFKTAETKTVNLV